MVEEKKKYDLEERTARFAERVRDFCLMLPKNAVNAEFIPQLLRAGSSPGANYIEANERLRLMITGGTQAIETERASLRQEAMEFVYIFTAILKKRNEV